MARLKQTPGKARHSVRAARLQRDGAHGVTRPTTLFVKGIIPGRISFFGGCCVARKALNKRRFHWHPALAGWREGLQMSQPLRRFPARESR